MLLFVLNKSVSVNLHVFLRWVDNIPSDANSLERQDIPTRFKGPTHSQPHTSTAHIEEITDDDDDASSQSEAEKDQMKEITGTDLVLTGDLTKDRGNTQIVLFQTQ